MKKYKEKDKSNIFAFFFLNSRLFFLRIYVMLQTWIYYLNKIFFYPVLYSIK